MKYHGRTQIELKDIHSGQIDRIVDNNTFMDTNIEAKFRNFGIFQTSVLNTFGTTALWQKLLGGLVMFDSAIADGANLPAAGQKMTARGYYGSSNNGSPVSLGSWNDTESALSSNAVQMVYDFTTSQGNGNIASVCLTSDYAGRVGFGNTAGDYNIGLRVNPGAWQTPSKTYSDNRWNGSVAFDGTYIYYGVAVDGTAMTIKRKYANALKVDLIHTLADSYDAGDINVTLPSAMVHTTVLHLMQASENKLVVLGADSRSIGNSASNVSVAVIDLTNSTATVHEISLGSPVSDQYGNILADTAQCIGMNSNGDVLIAFGVYDWMLKSVLVNVSTGNVIVFNDAHNYSEYTGQGYRSNTYITPIGNGQYVMAGNADTPGMICDYSDSSANYCEAGFRDSNPNINGLNLLNYQNINIGLTQNPFYLGTINNLSTPVTKTASQTMKVTYVIARA